ncbi:tumor necrosis factor ligand superfamily member 14-like [Oncorhynchus kisutch]|uniref:tumor necrosis factor ligand superfamily member 14-like n=1 Tax=Oncorhynchus kisutch TaxID=8019 RepID=UPI0012DC1C66|nr:tumor necrosis factor ligand superfamily member 14-like [Oncorhynchus kisutch]
MDFSQAYERELPPEIQRKPSAHLIGSSLLVGEDSVVKWESDKGLSAFTYQMDYKDGHLVAQRNGHYYVYSKVHFVEDCFLFKHKVMRFTEGYKDKPLVMMKANRFHCPSQDSRPKKISHQNLLNSYLGGVFHLLPGDIIYVNVDNGTLLRLGAEDNFMGAFMIRRRGLEAHASVDTPTVDWKPMPPWTRPQWIGSPCHRGHAHSGLEAHASVDTPTVDWKPMPPWTRPQTEHNPEDSEEVTVVAKQR